MYTSDLRLFNESTTLFFAYFSKLFTTFIYTNFIILKIFHHIKKKPHNKFGWEPYHINSQVKLEHKLFIIHYTNQYVFIYYVNLGITH